MHPSRVGMAALLDSTCAVNMILSYIILPRSSFDDPQIPVHGDAKRQEAREVIRAVTLAATCNSSWFEPFHSFHPCHDSTPLPEEPVSVEPLPCASRKPRA